MKSPFKNGRWTLNEAAERQADQEFYRQLTEQAVKDQAKSEGKDKPVILPTAVVRR